MRMNKEKLNGYYNNQLRKLLRTYEGYRFDPINRFHYIGTRFGRLRIMETEFSEHSISVNMMFRDRYKTLPNYDEFQHLPDINVHNGKWNFSFDFPLHRQGTIHILQNIAQLLDMVAEPIDMVEILKTYGFSMVSEKQLPFVEESEIDSDQIAQNKRILFIKRIHDFIWMQYDIVDGFITLLRTKETKISVDKVILPKPVRSEDDLKLLLDAIC